MQQSRCPADSNTTCTFSNISILEAIANQTMPLRFIKSAIHPPSRDFLLLDSAGALCSLVVHTVMALWLSERVGIPSQMLTLLAAIAFMLSIGSFISHRVADSKWPSYLKVIALINVTYCFITVAVLYASSSTLTLLGGLYFGLELICILALAVWEYRTAQVASLA